MAKIPHNPGMGEKAWDRFHELMARFNLKYGSKVVKSESKQAPKDAA